ncbi:MAG: UDP-N-acetylmuramoyl-L-alanine--D-glutamate ligase [Anaerolineae bacterium]|nr:UDP-N-acetylmuramoyl-L-alanine--D-glutamate ligase [Anaerolineae bacterium]
MTEIWSGKHVLIIGAARQGLALARYLIRRGAFVTLNDKRDAADLKSAFESMQGYERLSWALGNHDSVLLDGKDLLCLSGGVSIDLPVVLEARRRGLPVSNDTQIFMDEVCADVTGITGSAGKTTTTTLVGKMLKTATQAPHNAWIGGNIGQPLIEFVDQIAPDDKVLLELSSFQLELMHASPHIGAVLNITPNHLDRHGTLEAYTAAKAHILSRQKTGDVAVLNREDPGSWNLRSLVKGRLISFGMHPVPAGEEGSYCRDGQIFLKLQDSETTVLPLSLIKLRGDHNIYNVLAAVAIAGALNISGDIMRSVVERFSGVPHRLEFVREFRGSQWYNDSIATAPERTMAALHSFDEPLILLLGGRDKNLPWAELAALVHKRVKHVLVFGESAPKILAALGGVQTGEILQGIHPCDTLPDAVNKAASLVQTGDVVLLSPGGTSFDAFKDFEERGEQFRLWVNTLS